MSKFAGEKVILFSYPMGAPSLLGSLPASPWHPHAVAEEEASSPLPAVPLDPTYSSSTSSNGGSLCHLPLLLFFVLSISFLPQHVTNSGLLPSKTAFLTLYSDTTPCQSIPMLKFLGKSSTRASHLLPTYSHVNSLNMTFSFTTLFGFNLMTTNSLLAAKLRWQPSSSLQHLAFWPTCVFWGTFLPWPPLLLHYGFPSVSSFPYPWCSFLNTTYLVSTSPLMVSTKSWQTFLKKRAESKYFQLYEPRGKIKAIYSKIDCRFHLVCGLQFTPGFNYHL